MRRSRSRSSSNMSSRKKKSPASSCSSSPALQSQLQPNTYARKRPLQLYTIPESATPPHSPLQQQQHRRRPPHNSALNRHRFLWVVRRQPSSFSSSSEDQRGDGTYFEISEASACVDGVLLPGFADGTRDRGLIVPSWAPQTWILKHPAVGGFVSHCGWNSRLESIYHGVPILTWPMFAEQMLNAVMVRRACGVVVDLGVLEMGEFVEADRIERGIRESMEGERATRLRKRCSELSCKAKVALQSGGRSWTALDAAVSIWKQEKVGVRRAVLHCY